MKILVWGLGYVGTVSAACFAQLGHEVVGVEVNAVKVEAINSGGSAIKEPGLADLVRQMVSSGRLRAAQNSQGLVDWADVSLICVGTPSLADGSPNLDYIRNVAQNIGEGLGSSNHYHVVVLRSTVFPGTTQTELIPLLEKYSGRKAGRDFGVVMNPEFLREAEALFDFYHPPYTVIGELDDRAGALVEAVYQGIDAPVYHVGLREAELVKVVNNAFHALKTGFANEIGRVCERLEINSHVVMDLVCADTKLNISPAYMRPGFAFGGSCLPKDLRSLTFHAHQVNAKVPIIESILISNQYQVEEARLKIHEMNVQCIGILGLSFKSDTDDLRESPVISLIQSLWKDGFDVLVHDPDIQPEMMLGSNREYLERQLPQIGEILRPRIEDITASCRAIVLTQKRPEFISALQTLGDQQVVLDLVHIQKSADKLSVSNIQGLSW